MNKKKMPKWLKKMLDCLLGGGWEDGLPKPQPKPEPVPEPEDPPPPVVIEPPVVVDPPPSPRGWKVGPEVFKAQSGYRIVGLLAPDEEHLIVTTSHMFKPPYRSKIHIKRKDGPWHGAEFPYETIGQPWLHDGVVYFPAEHNPDGILAWTNERGVYRIGVKSPGRWFLAGWGALGLSNDSYANRRFRDNPKVFGVTGSYESDIPVNGVVRKVVEYNEDMVASINFADKTGVWFDDDERFIPGDQVCIEVHAGFLYGGGGAEFSQDKSGNNGNIYQWDGQGWVPIYFRHSGGVHQMHSDPASHVMWIAWDFPQRIGYLEAPHHVEMIDYPLHSQDKQSSFGCAVTTSPSGRVFWGHTPGRQGVVHEMVRA